MRISKETLFAIQNMQMMDTDGTVMKLFNPRGDPEYRIEVLGISDQISAEKR
jgi:hypothetical protein